MPGFARRVKDLLSTSWNQTNAGSGCPGAAATSCRSVAFQFLNAGRSKNVATLMDSASLILGGFLVGLRPLWVGRVHIHPRRSRFRRSLHRQDLLGGRDHDPFSAFAVVSITLPLSIGIIGWRRIAGTFTSFVVTREGPVVRCAAPDRQRNRSRPSRPPGNPFTLGKSEPDSWPVPQKVVLAVALAGRLTHQLTVFR